MKILALDTTGERLSLAIGENGRALAQRSRPGGVHDLRLFPELDRLFRRTRCSLRDIDAVAVATGPGRFTGIRIGMTFAAVLARALERPAAAVSLLEAAAHRAAAADAGSAGLLCAVMPGIRDEIFMQFFHCRRGVSEAAAEPLWALPQDAACRLKEAFKGSEIRLCGPAAAQALALAGGSRRLRVVPGSERPLAAADILPVALRRLSGKKPPPLVPLYLKPANYERVPTPRAGR